MRLNSGSAAGDDSDLPSHLDLPSPLAPMSFETALARYTASAMRRATAMSSTTAMRSLTGRQSDFLRDCPAPQVQECLVIENSTKMSSLLPTPAVSTKKSGDRVCDPLPCVVYGSSCHTADYLTEKKDSEDSVSCPKYICKSPSPRTCVHVISKSCANSSRHTQCAAVANLDARPYVFHRRLRRAQNKRNKQDRLLRDMVVPPHQVKLSTTEIDSEIIVFDGGGQMSPPIHPPDGILWRSIPVGNLHIEDELSGDMGLSFPRIDGTSPFIRLPHQMSLEIISHVGLPAIYDA